MKAKQVLEWIVEKSINGENLNFVYVPEEGQEEWEQNEEWWLYFFGAVPPGPVPVGRYLYFYSDVYNEIDYDGKYEKVFAADAEIEVDPGNCTIYLYRIED